MGAGRSDHLACLLLGSNIRPEEHLPLALQRLRALLTVERISSTWQTPAVGSAGPDFFNAAVLVRTGLRPEELKAQVLRPLEAELGRVRGADKNAPRTMDIDVIVWDGQVIDPQLWTRAHVAVPVAEVWPGLLTGPGGETLAQAAARLAQSASIRPAA